MKREPAAFFVAASIALVAICAAALAVGSVAIDPLAGIAGLVRAGTGAAPGPESVIVSMRLSRIALSLLVGASLAAAGAAFQSVFGNPLADPYVIGASSGASLGAVCAIVLGLELRLPFASGVGASAFVGAAGAVALVYGIARLASGRDDPAIVLLAGAAVGNFISAIVTLILVAHDRELGKVFFWLLGGFSGASWGKVGGILPILTAACLVILASARPLDLLASGEDEAATLGLDPRVARIIAGGGAVLATAGAVSAAETIGFVGLMAPHIARAFVGAGNRRAIPAAMLVGAILTTAADLAARTVFSPIEVPVGAFTAALGAPFFLFRIVRSARGGPK
ncbi:MAG: iron ABC transporter permease [Spirochaetes bacterium]|nr:iron ABC transporter permease [Spirochaetota bacterium]